MVNNIEFGVYFERKTDYVNYCEIFEEVISLGLNETNFHQKRLNVKKVDVVDIAKELKVVDLGLAEDKNGKEHLRLYIDSDKNKYIEVEIGSEILLKEKDRKRMEELLNNYDFYIIGNSINTYYKFGLKS